MNYNNQKIGLYNEVSEPLFNAAVTAHTEQEVTVEDLSAWFNHAKSIDDIEVVYWITPGVVLGAIIKDNETDKRTYIIIEPNSLFLSDPIPDGLSEKIGDYKTAKTTSDYGIICAVAADPYVEECVVTNDIVTVQHYHCDTALRLTNVGSTINTEQFIDDLKTAYNEQITESMDNTLDVIQLNTEQNHTILSTSKRSSDNSITIRFNSRTTHTPYDLLTNNTYTTDTLAYIWGTIARGKNILCCGPSPAIQNEIIEALTHFIPTENEITAYTLKPRLNPPHKNLTSLVHQPHPQLTPQEITKQINKTNPEYTITTMAGNGEIKPLLTTNNSPGIIAGLHSKTPNNPLEDLLNNNTNIEPSDFDTIINHEYLFDGIGVNERIIKTKSNNELKKITQHTHSLPCELTPTDSIHVPTEEIQQRKEALNNLLSKDITNPDKQLTFLSKYNNHIQNNTQEEPNVKIDTLTE